MKYFTLFVFIFSVSCSLEKFERPSADGDDAVAADSDDSGGAGDNDTEEISDEEILELSGVVCTGQKKCYDSEDEIKCPEFNEDFYGTDGQYAMEEKCIARSYKVETSLAGDVVIDNATGLQWQRNISTTGYSWSDADIYCQGLEYAGYGDWRLPDYDELWSIVDHGVEVPPAINVDVFPYCPEDIFWTSTEYASDKTIGLVIDFKYGITGLRYKHGINFVRCVRNAKLPGNVFKVEEKKNDKVAIDRSTGLVWALKVFSEMSWGEALNVCKSLNYGGRSAWRLPNINELQTLMNFSEKDDSAADFPFNQGGRYWSSTTDLLYYDFYALTVDFTNDEITGNYKPDMAGVICVTRVSGDFGPCNSDNGCQENRKCINGGCALPDSFVSKWSTTYNEAPDNHTIRLPLVENGKYDFTVDWGDGTSGRVTKWDSIEADHTYKQEGKYVVVIEGTISGWQFCNLEDISEGLDCGDSQKLLEIGQWGGFSFGSTESQFMNCMNLDIKAVDVPDLDGTTSLKNAFNSCENLKANEHFNEWDVSGIKNMENMFYSATVFNGKISDWNVSNVVYMNGMFNSAVSFNQDISKWNVSKVADMKFMFYAAESFKGDISNWDVSNVRNMWYMFAFSSFDGDLSKWDVSNVIQTSGMFLNTPFNSDISGWNVSNLTSAESMFYGASKFDKDISGWNVSNVTDMSEMFGAAVEFNQDVSGWDVSKVTDMSRMFFHAYKFNKNISKWNVSKVLYMQEMFANAGAFNQNLSDWDVSSVIDMTSMFDKITLSTANYDAILNGWSGLVLQNDVDFHGGNSKYSSAAEAARAKIINDFNWTIIDGGKVEE